MGKHESLPSIDWTTVKRIEKKQQINHVTGIENATDSGQLIDNWKWKVVHQMYKCSNVYTDHLPHLQQLQHYLPRLIIHKVTSLSFPKYWIRHTFGIKSVSVSSMGEAKGRNSQTFFWVGEQDIGNWLILFHRPWIHNCPLHRCSNTWYWRPGPHSTLLRRRNSTSTLNWVPIFICVSSDPRKEQYTL